MLTKRRPVKQRARYARRIPREINFPQLRKEVRLFSDAGLLLKESEFYRTYTFRQPVELR